MKATTFIVLMLLAANASAADWIEINRTKDDEAILIDSESIKYSNPNKTHRKAWVKVVDPKGDYTMSFNEFDCDSGAVKFNTLISYNKAGKVKSQESLASRGWQDMPPGAVYEYINKTVCSYPYLD